MGLHRWVLGITGGSGFIGSSLAMHLSEFFDIKLLDIKEPKKSFNNIVRFEKCDVRHYEKVKKGLKDVDLIIHAAIIQIPLINNDKKLGYEVNFLGTQNVCKAVEDCDRSTGLILAGSWHTVGERGLRGILDEEFGFRPDKVEDRSRLYALAKIGQESIVRFYDEMSEKVFGIIRMGTVLGEGMPEKTAANLFIENGINGKNLTPFKHSMFRPMLYVDVNDVCRAYGNLARMIFEGRVLGKSNSLAHIFNVCYPEPLTILELAQIVRESILQYSNCRIAPEIKVIDEGRSCFFSEEEKKLISVDISKALNFLKLGRLKSPKESIEELIKCKFKRV